jgi:hypothetical protein
MSMSDDRSSNWTLRRVLEVSAQLASSTDQLGGTSAANAAEGKTKRFTLDYATWRAHIAAPGSHFEPEQTAEPRIIHLDPARYAAASLETEKRTA